LKPCAAADIAKALEKIRLLQGEKQEKKLLDTAIIQRLSETFTPPQYKQRFLVKLGDNMTSVPVEDILFFWSENKIVFLRHTNGKKYIADFTLEQLENVLNPQHFFRINRQFLLSLTAIKQLTAHSNSRLKVFLNYPPDENEVIVARERVEAFKNWLDR
jgi:DNA-binding LytR/AlgR family response regulator